MSEILIFLALLGIPVCLLWSVFKINKLQDRIERLEQKQWPYDPAMHEPTRQA